MEDEWIQECEVCGEGYDAEAAKAHLTETWTREGTKDEECITHCKGCVPPHVGGM
tara:strand:- start:141 stop:305 length:165 start_codon:yes stop_codon:yes gene_type:complete